MKFWKSFAEQAISANLYPLSEGRIIQGAIWQVFPHITIYQGVMIKANDMIPLSAESMREDIVCRQKVEHFHKVFEEYDTRDSLNLAMIKIAIDAKDNMWKLADGRHRMIALGERKEKAHFLVHIMTKRSEYDALEIPVPS